MRTTTLPRLLQKRSVLYAGIWISLIVLASTAVLHNQHTASTYKGIVSEIWLPSYNDEVWFDGTKSAVEGVKVVDDAYGKAVVFHSTMDMDFEIYITNKNDKLDISRCPDVFDVRSEGTTCEQVGTTAQSATYAMSPSYASGSGVGYIERGNVFIAFLTGGDSSTTNVEKDARSFRQIPNDQVDALLKTNKATVEKHNASIRKKEAEQRRLESQAYLHLPFTPYLPAHLPNGWSRDTLQVIATDPLLPTFVEASYSNDLGQVILRVGKLSSFKLSTTCGPSPGAGGEHLPCTWQTAHNYYRSVTHGEDYTLDYIYKPLPGDSLAIISTSTCCDTKLFPIPAATLAAQQYIADNLVQVDPSLLKAAEYLDMFYY